MAKGDFTEYARVSAGNSSAVAVRQPLDLALGTRFVGRVSQTLDDQIEAGRVLNYAWSLPSVEALSHTAHPYAKLQLAIDTSCGRMAGSLHVSFGGFGEPSLILTGHTDALLLTSLFEKAWFPGEPGQSKTRGGASGANLLGENRDVEIRLARAKGNNAYIPLSKKESDELTVALWGELPEQREARQRVQEEIASLPTAATQFRDKVCEHVMWNVRIMQHVLKQAEGGYSFRRSALEDCWTALDELTGAIREMQPGDVVFDPALRDMEIAEIIDKRIAGLTTHGGHP